MSTKVKAIARPAGFCNKPGTLAQAKAIATKLRSRAVRVLSVTKDGASDDPKIQVEGYDGVEFIISVSGNGALEWARITGGMTDYKTARSFETLLDRIKNPNSGRARSY